MRPRPHLPAAGRPESNSKHHHQQMKKTATASLHVLLLCILAMPVNSAETPPADVEISRQQSILHGRGDRRLEGYVIDRGLAYYVHALMPGFENAVDQLGAGDRWLDIGAGRGQAIIDYYAAPGEASTPRMPLRRKANTVAMSIEDRRMEAWHQTAANLEPGQMRYVFDKPLRNFSLSELGGQFHLISDMIGGFSYTEELSVFMETVMGLLAVNGNFFTALQDVRSEEGDNRPFYPNEPFLTRIFDEKGAETSICAWLRQIQCAEVVCMPRSGWKPPLQTYRVRKTCEAVSVPRLERTRFVAGTPPERVFRITPAAKPAAVR
jgi:hypothetical protein